MSESIIEVFIENGKTYAKLNDLKNWEKNPRGIKVENFEKLKKQLLKLGQYKPLLIMNDGITLGGNMRLRGYQYLLQELSEVGSPDALTKKYGLFGDEAERAKETIDAIQKGIWVSIVTPKDEKEKLEYALSDNDRAGYYEMDSVMNILSEFPEDDFIKDYSIEVGDPLNLSELVAFENKDSDELNKEVDPNDLGKNLNVTCPRCGFEFENKKHEHEDDEDDYDA